MSTELDHAVKDAITTLVDDTPALGEPPTAITTASYTSVGKRRVLGAAAAVALGVAGVGALVYTQQPGVSPAAEEPGDPLPAVAPLLSSVQSLGNEQWVVAGPLPIGVEAQIAYEQSGVGQNIQYGLDAPTESLSIFTGPNIAPLQEGTEIDVDGTIWSINFVDGYGSATRDLTSGGVMVSGIFSSEVDLVEQIEDLLVVEQSEVPVEPLIFSQDAMTPVASFNVDGRTIEISAEVSNGWYCLYTRQSTDRGGGGCGTYFDPTDHLLSEQSGFGRQSEDDPFIRTEASGLASTDVVSIEVDWFDGTTSTVTPQNTSDQLTDARFWATGTTIELEPGQNTDAINITTEVRAIDANGEVIATVRDGELVDE